MTSTRTASLALVCAGLIAATAGTASATTINSFLSVPGISGITISPSVASPNLNYTITFNAGATFTYNSNTYAITDVMGFYLIAPGYDDASQGSLANFGGFSDDSDHRAAGSIYGWRSNPNAGITSGNSQAFTFPSISSANYTLIGLHVRINGTFPGTSGNTGNITGNITGALVPAPGAAAILGLSGLMATRRRR
ncbi:MAG: hypothetical protein Q8L55_10400 [Phycisphaerales bacterium]|nr:hypothetical protein [Phycisphaerales bacterium]